MKSHPLILLAAVLACHGSAAAQNGSRRAQEVLPRAHMTSVLHDGIVFDGGQTFLIRYGRAALVNTALVPEGKVLTLEGRLLTLPTDFFHDLSPRVRVGLFTNHGKVYLMRNGRVARVDEALVPQGMVLTAAGQREPLPSDFSGFVRDRAPDGTVLPTPPALDGPQTLAGQAGVTRAPSLISHRSGRGLTPPSEDVPRAVAAPAGEEIRMALPRPMALLPPVDAAATILLLRAVAATGERGRVKE